MGPQSPSHPIWLENGSLLGPFLPGPRQLQAHSYATASLEAGSYTGYQAEMNIKAWPGHVSFLGGRLTMQQVPKRYENS